MKQFIRTSLRLTAVCLVLFGAVYPILVWLIAQLSPSKGEPEMIVVHGETVAYTLLAQPVDRDDLFQPRPSAVGYNASASGASNKGPTDKEYLQVQEARLDTFLMHNPSIRRSQVPSELICASGSGLDPDLSLQAAYVQIPRIAALRGMSSLQLQSLVDQCAHQAWFGIVGPAYVNVNEMNAKLMSIDSKANTMSNAVVQQH